MFSVKQDFAAARFDQAGDGAKRRALARAVRADERDDAAGFSRRNACSALMTPQQT